MTDAVPAKPAGRSLRIALMVSLALNVLIIGGVASALIVSHHHHWRGGHGHKGSLLLSFAETLPSDQGDAIRQKVQSERTVLDPLRKAEREARDAARGILMTEPFDAQKFKAALDRIADADAKVMSARMTIFADTVATFTPEERRQLHNWFEERHKRGGHHGDDDQPPPPPQ
jgi:uncharacterized membrane protein